MRSYHPSRGLLVERVLLQQKEAIVFPGEETGQKEVLPGGD